MSAPESPLSKLRPTTPTQRQLWDAMTAGGWTIVVVPFPNAVVLGHPSNVKERPTPDYAREEYAPGRASYPFPTYHTLRQVTVLYRIDGEPKEGEPVPIKISSVFLRDSEVPWVESRDHSASLRDAIAYVRAPHPADEEASQ